MTKEVNELNEKSTTQEIITSWDTTGFLEGLDEFMMEKVALSFHTAKLWIDNNPVRHEKLELLIFPLIRRVMGQIHNITTNKRFTEEIKLELLSSFDTLALIDQFARYDSILESIQDLHGVIDVEALAVAHLSDVMVEYFGSKAIKEKTINI